MRFEHPEWLWLSAVATGLGIALIYLWYRRRSEALARLGSAGMLERLTQIDLSGAPVRRAALMGLGLGFLGLAVAGPQWGAQEVEEQTRSLNIVLAMDISESLWAEDVRPNRLERARLEGRRLVTELAGHRVGLVAFAGAAYRLSPLTVDHGAIQLFLDALDPTMAGTPGSSLAAAIRQAVSLLQESEDEKGAGDRAIIMVTDGETHDEENDVLEAAREARSAGIRIYALGVGLERGEPIPRYDRLGEPLGGYKRDDEGEVVLSRLTRQPLEDAATMTSGLWVRAEDGGASRVVAALADLERGTGAVTRGVRWTPRFQLFLALALVLVGLDWVWAWRGSR